MPLELTDFDQTGHDPDALALFVAGAAPGLYADPDRSGTQSPEAGELGIGAGQTRISGIRLLTGNRIALQDNNNPVALSLSDYFSSSGSSIWTLHVQTDDGVVSSDQIHSAGNDVVRYQFAQADAAVLNAIAAGDRVILAVTRPTRPVAAAFAGAVLAASAAVVKRSPALRPVAASFAGSALAASAAVGKRAQAFHAVAASFAGSALAASAAVGKRSPDPPRAVLVASQASVERGRSVELRWAVANAVSVEIDQGIGAVPAAGTMRVAPEASTTWTLTASAYGLEAVASVTIAVEPRAAFGETLLPLNATPFERAMEAALNRDLDLPIRKLWSAADCPVALLPYLAWALGVEEWDPDWPAAVKRAAVANAFAVHREKGTLAGLKRVLSTAGAEYEYVERPAGVAMTAKLSILNSNAVYLPDIARSIGRVKRASLQLDIELLSSAAGEIPVAGGLGAATVAEIGGLTNHA